MTNNCSTFIRLIGKSPIFKVSMAMLNAKPFNKSWTEWKSYTVFYSWDVWKAKGKRIIQGKYFGKFFLTFWRLPLTLCYIPKIESEGTEPRKPATQMRDLTFPTSFIIIDRNTTIALTLGLSFMVPKRQSRCYLIQLRKTFRGMLWVTLLSGIKNISQ